MSLSPLQHVAGFYATWSVSAVAVTVADPGPAHLGELIQVQLGGGLTFPLITGCVGMIGVIAGGAMAPKSEPPLGLVKSGLVMLALTAAVLMWIAESRPGLLFSFVIALGLGFSGYSIIELIGEEVKNFVKRIVERATSALDFLGKKEDK